MKMKFVTSAAMALALIACASAHAATLNWTLHDVTFDDGGTASGTFSTDSSSGGVTAFNITTTAGTTLGGAVYDASTSSLYANNYWSANSFLLVTTTPFAIPYLNLAFASALTSGGVNPLRTDGILNGSWECNNCTDQRIVTAGYAAAVPEPASWALMISGFGGLGAALRTQRRKQAVAAV